MSRDGNGKRPAGARDSDGGRRVRRVLSSADPRASDFREAQAWVEDIRSRLGHIRGELRDVGRIEARFDHDRLCDDVAGALTLAISALYRLVEGERSFEGRAVRNDELWADVAADPDAYVVNDKSDWDWRPSGIFKKGGAACSVRRNGASQSFEGQVGGSVT